MNAASSASSRTLYAIFMNRILTLIVAVFMSLTNYGQDKNVDRTISFQDSILLRNFWTDLTSAINTNDKNRLAALCEFPFYCRPCIDDTTLKNNDHVTIKVTKQLFYQSQYKEFFDKPVRDEVEKHKSFDKYFFHPSFNDKNKRNGFMFSYTIVAPSKTWEGLQGFIYLRKVKGQYKITGIDTVP